MREYTEENRLCKDRLWLLRTPRTSAEILKAAEDTARGLGFRQVDWFQAGGVITTHGSPGAIAVAGFAEN